MNISVCMATCNGQRFLREQINSILLQLSEDDELIIVDDASTDFTPEILNALFDTRIRYSQNAVQAGHVQTFSHAISFAKNDIIVLADQDDIWTENRLNILKATFTENTIDVIAGNFSLIDENGTLLAEPTCQLKTKDSTQNFSNVLNIFLGKQPYYGCAMAFRRELRDIILPIPQWVESHDLWIAFAGNLRNRIFHIEENLLFKRKHNKNVSTKKRRHLGKIIISRITMLASLIILSLRKN